jgi:nitroreductase
MHDAEAEVVDAALTSRRSVRAFLPTEVPRTTVEHLLTVSARSASVTTIQPLQAHVLMGEAKTRLSVRILEAFIDPSVAKTHESEFPIYPSEWVSPFIDRRRKVGWDLYGLLGIGKGDFERTHAQHARNFKFFDAPVGFIFTIHRSLGYAAWVDYGMFLGNLMAAARGHGLHTCPQFAFSQFHRIIREELKLGDEHKVICGVALGFEDTSAVENSLRTERAPLSDWAKFY